MEQNVEKDNFWMYIAGVVVLAVVLVFAFKSQKSAMEPGVNDRSAQAESQAEINKTLDRIHSKK